jgi:hypothetical protein
VRHDRVEVPIAQQRHHQVDATRRQTDTGDQPFLPELEQLAERAAGSGDVVRVRCIFRIVQVHQVDVVETERRQALFQRPPYPGAIEDIGGEVAIDL